MVKHIPKYFILSDAAGIRVDFLILPLDYSLPVM